MSFTQASRSFNVLAWRARNTPFTFSRRSAAFMITGESEWETGSPATPFIRADGSEREHATRAYSEHAAYDSLFPHAQPDQRIFVTLLFQELHHCYVVVERGRGAYDFVEVGRVSSHFMERLFQVLGSAKVVKRNN